jgi:hypothetical protein
MAQYGRKSCGMSVRADKGKLLTSGSCLRVHSVAVQLSHGLFVNWYRFLPSVQLSHGFCENWHCCCVPFSCHTGFVRTGTVVAFRSVVTRV